MGLIRCTAFIGCVLGLFQSAYCLPVAQTNAQNGGSVNLYSGQRIARVWIESEAQARALEDQVMEVFDHRVLPGRHVQVRATETELAELSENGYSLQVRIFDIDHYLRTVDQHPADEEERVRVR